ncbi:MAG: hypothetical protein H8D78_19805 [Chloroflexi bacterium]|nr:hypothetical protein [Chloroflexota bacterium]
MHPARQLYQLQETDLSLAAVAQRLVEIAAVLGETEELQAARQAVQSTEAELQRWQVTRRDRELEVSSLSGKIKGSEDRLYSGRVRNPKELKGLEDELDSLRRRREGVEEAQLEAMLEVERLQSVRTAQMETLDTIGAEWQAAQEVLRAEQADLKRQQGQLQARRQRQAAAAGDDLQVYKNLRPRRGGRPVAILKGGVCQTCGMALPTGEAQRARHNPELCFCSSCGRVLWAE